MHAILHSFTYPLKPLTQASISIQPIPILHATHNHVLSYPCALPFNHTTKPVSLSKPSPACGILPKKCHVALSPLHTQTVPLATRSITHSTWVRIMSGRRPTFSGCLTSGILSDRHSTLSGYFTSGLTPDGRGGRFNFPGQTCPDPLIALTWRASVVAKSDSPDSLARQTLTICRIHFHPR